jgi:hypothetical protein
MDVRRRELYSFFLGISIVLLALVEICVSVMLYLITYMSLLSWKPRALVMGKIEDELDPDVSKEYDHRQKDTPDKSICNTLMRVRFSSLCIILWLGIAGSLVYALSATYYLRSLRLCVPGSLVLLAIIVFVPWVYLAGSDRLPLFWNTLRALWVREV